MKVVYQTVDGHCFDERECAQEHEDRVLKHVRMWNWEKKPTTDTSQARVVYLVGEHAGAYFKAMIQANPNECGAADSCFDTIDDEDNGWFYWDEYAETYRFIDDDIVDTFIIAKSAEQEN
jgi:hypothetical protein